MTKEQKNKATEWLKHEIETTKWLIEHDEPNDVINRDSLKNLEIILSLFNRIKISDDEIITVSKIKKDKDKKKNIESEEE